jgi:hypothetical protein
MMTYQPAKEPEERAFGVMFAQSDALRPHIEAGGFKYPPSYEALSILPYLPCNSQRELCPITVVRFRSK